MVGGIHHGTGGSFFISFKRVNASCISQKSFLFCDLRAAVLLAAKVPEHSLTTQWVLLAREDFRRSRNAGGVHIP